MYVNRRVLHTAHIHTHTCSHSTSTASSSSAILCVLLRQPACDSVGRNVASLYVCVCLCVRVYTNAVLIYTSGHTLSYTHLHAGVLALANVRWQAAVDAAAAMLRLNFQFDLITLSPLI